MTAAMTLPLADPDVPTLDEQQAVLIDAVFAEWAKGVRATILQAATGVGKTHMTTLIVKRSLASGARRALFVCPMRELVKQAAAEFRAAGLPVAVEMAERRALDRIDDTWGGGARVVVGCTATLKGPRLDRWPADTFDLLVFDEAHLAAADSSLAIRDHFAGASRILGLTATPFRMDGKPLHGTPESPFGTLACRYSLPEAIGNGHLADVRAVTCPVDVDLKGVVTSRQAGGVVDFSLGQLEERLGPRVEELCNAFRDAMEKYGLTRCLLVAPSVATADAMAQGLVGVGIRSRAVHGQMPRSLADSVIAQYREGDLPVLCSCNMLSAGFNDPPTSALLMARATKSLVLFQQTVGRVTRLWPGKPIAFVVGPEWRGAKGVMSTLDLFAESEPDPKVRAMAKRIAAGKAEVDPRAVLEEAKARVAEDEARERAGSRLRIRAKKKEVKHKPIEWSPFAAARVLGVRLDQRRDYHATGTDEAPAGQKQLLMEYGIAGTDGLDAATAGQLVAAALDRTFKGLVTPKQIDFLRRLGWSASDAASLTQREWKREFLKAKERWSHQKRA